MVSHNCSKFRMNSSNSSYASFKTEGSPNAIVKSSPLASSEYSLPALVRYESYKKKSTKGDTATVISADVFPLEDPSGDGKT